MFPVTQEESEGELEIGTGDAAGGVETGGAETGGIETGGAKIGTEALVAEFLCPLCPVVLVEVLVEDLTRPVVATV